MTGHDSELLARFDELLRALEGCVDERERARLVSEFADDETRRWEQSAMEPLRARDAVGDEELLSRIQQAPEMGETPMFSRMRSGSGTEDKSRASPLNAMDLRRWLTVGVLGALAVVFGTVAIVGVRFGSSLVLIVLAAALCAVSAVVAMLVAAQCLRRFDVSLDDQVNVDLAWLLEPRRHSHTAAELGRHVNAGLDFGEFPGRPNGSDAGSALNLSLIHI